MSHHLSKNCRAPMAVSIGCEQRDCSVSREHTAIDSENSLEGASLSAPSAKRAVRQSSCSIAKPSCRVPFLNPGGMAVPSTNPDGFAKSPDIHSRGHRRWTSRDQGYRGKSDYGYIRLRTSPYGWEDLERDDEQLPWQEGSDGNGSEDVTRKGLKNAQKTFYAVRVKVITDDNQLGLAGELRRDCFMLERVLKMVERFDGRIVLGCRSNWGEASDRLRIGHTQM